MIGYWAAGLWTPSVSRDYLWSLPTVLLAILVGRLINRRLDVQRLFVDVHTGLIVSDAGTVWQAIVFWARIAE